MKKSPAELLAIVAACSLASMASLRAQQTWNGSAGQQWSDAANWTPSGVPSGTALEFGLATNYSVNLGNVTRSILEATFTSANEYTFDGGGASGLFSFGTGTGITLNGAGAVTFNSAVSFTGSTLRTVGGSGAGTITFNGAVTRGAGAITFGGGNEVIMGGSSVNSFGSADVTVSNGTTLTIGKTTGAAQNVALGTGRISLSAGTLKIENSGATLSNTLLMASTGGTIETDEEVTLTGILDIQASRSLTLNNTKKITHTGTVRTSGSGGGSGVTRFFTLAGTGDVDFTGPMIDGTDRRLGIVKTNTGTFRFSGNATYTGTTEVSAGTLLVNGTTSGQGSFTANESGILGGTGTIGLGETATLSLASADAQLAPGDGGVGTLTIDGGGTNNTAGLILNSGTLVFDLAGLSSDKIVVANFALGAGGGSSTAGVGGIQVTFNGSADLSGHAFELIEFASTPGIGADRFALSAESLGAGWAGSFSYDGNTLTFAAIPEAGTGALFACAATLLGACGLRRKAAK